MMRGTLWCGMLQSICHNRISDCESPIAHTPLASLVATNPLSRHSLYRFSPASSNLYVCMFIHGRPSGSNGTTDIYNQTTCKRMLHKIVSLLENSQHSQHSRLWRFVDQCLPASQITCRLGVPSAPASGQHEQAYSPYRRTQNERHSSVQIKR